MASSSRLDRHAKLVERMADTVGADLTEAAQRGEIGEGVLDAAVYSCTGCTHTGDCEDWLQDHADGAEETPEYCRNKALFDRLVSR